MQEYIKEFTELESMVSDNIIKVEQLKESLFDNKVIEALKQRRFFNTVTEDSICVFIARKANEHNIKSKIKEVNDCLYEFVKQDLILGHLAMPCVFEVLCNDIPTPVILCYIHVGHDKVEQVKDIAGPLFVTEGAMPN